MALNESEIAGYTCILKSIRTSAITITNMKRMMMIMIMMVLLLELLLEIVCKTYKIHMHRMLESTKIFAYVRTTIYPFISLYSCYGVLRFSVFIHMFYILRMQYLFLFFLMFSYGRKKQLNKH